jgi:16S rRNA (cytosine1402-N4)-methyltransferase
MSGAAGSHIPVMRTEAVAALNVRPAGSYLDGTFGRGGHASAVLEQLGPDGRLLVMDKDPDAIAVARHRFGGDARVRIRQGSFAELERWDETSSGIDGALFDLGISSPQIDNPERGFSFQGDGPLDMRMDPATGESAADFIARADERELCDVLWTYGEEREGRRIARAIIAARAIEPIVTTRALAELVARAIGYRERGQHPATRTFQALRIAINREIEDLERGLEAATARLKPGGRLVVISFHSLEDRVVKHFIRDAARTEVQVRRGLPPMPTGGARLEPVDAPRRPGEDEVSANPRSRSAVMRVAERLPTMMASRAQA